MKKNISSITLFVCIAFVAKAQDSTIPNPANPNAPKFKFETEVIDYGTIERNANGDREFKFTNVGKEPLIITSAVPSCGCTTPYLPKDPILPSESSTIKVHYATDRVGAFEKTITLNSNSDTPIKKIIIKGVIKPEPTNPALPSDKR